METLTLTLASGLPANVQVAGSGPPLIFLHDHLGREWNAFLAALSEHFNVYAPRHPGSEEPDELMQLDAVSDLALYYDDLMNALDLDHAVVAGHSFGGMAAAEFAAHCPGRVHKLVLLDSLGLWLDAEPIPDISSEPPSRVLDLLSASPEVSKELLAKPEDPAAVPDFMLGRYLTQAAVSHFIWPIPDRELRRRLYRITMPALVVWGEEDRYVPLVYGREFAKGLPDARLEVIPGVGHTPHLENTDAVVDCITKFAAD